MTFALFSPPVPVSSRRWEWRRRTGPRSNRSTIMSTATQKKPTAEAVKDAAGKATETLKDAASTVTEKLEEGASFVARKADDATSAVGSGMESLAGTIRER